MGDGRGKSEGKAGGWWQALGRWASVSESELDAERLRTRAHGAGYAALADVGDREVATVRGTLRTVTLQPRAGVPALEAEMYDGSGVLTLIWLGQRRIGGVDCGRRIVVSGRLATFDGRRVMYNPRYDLLPADAA